MIFDINNLYVNLYLFDFIFYFVNSQINFSQYFIFYFFILSSIFFLKNYFYCIKFSLVEFPFIFIISLLFIYLLFFVNDFILAYLCLEGLGFSTYIIFGLSYDNNIRYEGVLKYFILNSFASILFLFGTTFIYLYTLNTSFNSVTLFLDSNFFINENLSFIIVIGLLLIISSFFFKLGIFPCIFWIIDIYESLALSFTFILLTLYKFILFLLFIHILTNIFSILNFIWQPLLFFSALGSLIVGCIGALIQNKLKRFIGYASVNQIGYILLGLSCGTNEGILASYNFLVFYIIVNLIFFSFIFYTQYAIIISNKIIYKEFYYITDLVNLSKYISGSLLFIFIITIIAIIGLPPLTNFFIKYDLLISILYTFKMPYLIIFIILIVTGLSSFYYIRLLKILFFDRSIIIWKNFKQRFFKLNIFSICLFYLFNFYYFFFKFMNQFNFLFFSFLNFNFENKNLFSFTMLLKTYITTNINIIKYAYLNNTFLIIDFWTVVILIWIV
jgi:NADH-quinone oxidoreductase subunit N